MNIAIWIAIALVSFVLPAGRMPLTYTLTFASLACFGALIAVAAAGPVRSWLNGERRGYEQRRLWPNGVTVA